jgi:diamine N-acetyltransferase
MDSIGIKDKKITLREVNKENWRAVSKLTVLDRQKENLASNVMSLCESHYAEDSWVRAVYADETPIGFLMMSIWEPEEWYAVWRFMIDHQYQGLGFGKLAIKMSIDHIKENYPQAKMIRLMVRNKALHDSPYNFYSNLGWKDISDINEEGEIEMGLYI